MLITLRDLGGASLTLEIEKNITLKTLKEKANKEWHQQGHVESIDFLVHDGLKMQDKDMLCVEGKGMWPCCVIKDNKRLFNNGVRESLLSDATDFWMIS